MIKKVFISIFVVILSLAFFSCNFGGDGGAKKSKSNGIAVPVLSPAAGDYSEGSKTISISIEDSDLDVYYTTDGSEPTNASSRYTAPFKIIGSKTVRAVAYYGETKSSVVTGIYNLNAGKSQSQLGVITGVIGLAENFSQATKDSLAAKTVYIYSDELPGMIVKSAVGESFYIDGLDTSKSYSFYFSNKAPGTVIGSREAEVQKDSDGSPIVSVKVSDVTPKDGYGLDLSTVELKPTGTITGVAKKYSEDGKAAHYI